MFAWGEWACVGVWQRAADPASPRVFIWQVSFIAQNPYGTIKPLAEGEGEGEGEREGVGVGVGAAEGVGVGAAEGAGEDEDEGVDVGVGEAGRPEANSPITSDVGLRSGGAQE